MAFLVNYILMIANFDLTHVTSYILIPVHMRAS